MRNPRRDACRRIRFSLVLRAMVMVIIRLPMRESMI
jgi:hypothetical protein